MLEELRRFGKEFNATGIPRLKRSWKNWVWNEDFVEESSELGKGCIRDIHWVIP
jgi:hypothetical protein